MPLGDTEWTAEDWDLNSEKWSELEGEISTYNPGIRVMDRPKWIKSPSALPVEKKEKSSIIVAVQATEWIREQLTRERPYLALFGERCSFSKYIKKVSSTHCERCLQFGHHAAHCRLQAVCKFCHEITTLRTTTATTSFAVPAKASRAHTLSENTPAVKKHHTSPATGIAPPGPEQEAQQ